MPVTIFKHTEHGQTGTTAIVTPTVVCDFCSRTPVVAKYNARDFQMSDVSSVKTKERLTQVSNGGWGACARCEQLVDMGAWEKIAHNALQDLNLTKADPIYPEMLRVLLQTYDQLRGQSEFKKVKENAR